MRKLRSRSKYFVWIAYEMHTNQWRRHISSDFFVRTLTFAADDEKKEETSACVLCVLCTCTNEQRTFLSMFINNTSTPTITTTTKMYKKGNCFILAIIFFFFLCISWCDNGSDKAMTTTTCFVCVCTIFFHFKTQGMNFVFLFLRYKIHTSKILWCYSWCKILSFLCVCELFSRANNV